MALFVLFTMAFFVSCKKDNKTTEPEYVLQRWAKAIEELNYRSYSKCEAYPKDVSVFKEMYRDYYLADMMVVDVPKPNEEDVRKDYKNESYIHTSIRFEPSAVKRDTKKPYQLIRGDAVFVKFLDGGRKNDGWLLSNRTLTRINR